MSRERVQKYSAKVRARFSQRVASSRGMSGASTPLPAPRSARPFATASEWCSNHHVVFSQGNTTLPKARRTYFDGLPQVRVREGAYADVPLYRPQVDNDPSAYEHRLHWQFTNYPLVDNPRERLSRRAQPFYQGDPSASNVQVNSAREAGTSDRHVAAAPSGAGRRGRKLEISTRTALADVPTAAEYGRFVDWCRAEHGHMVSLWWKLDDNKNMNVCKAEFLKGLSRLHYRGDTKRLWAELDRDNSNTISFIHFCPEIALDLAQFKRWAELRFGSLAALFHLFDADRSGKLTIEEFRTACDRESIPPRLKGSVVALFQLLGGWDTLTGLSTVSKEDLIPFESWVFPGYLWEEPGLVALAKFQNALCARHHGNPLIAWRKALDKNSDMKLGYTEFRTSYLEVIHLTQEVAAADVNAVYCAMDTARSGWIALTDWDKVSHHLLADFATWAKTTFGKPSRCVRAWEEQHGEGVGPEAFERGVAPLELSDSQVIFLFGGLSLEGVVCGTKPRDPKYKKAGKVTQAKLTFLDHWELESQQIERDAWKKMAARRMTVVERTPMPCDSDEVTD